MYLQEHLQVRGSCTYKRFLLSEQGSQWLQGKQKGETERHLSTSDLGRALEWRTHTLVYLAITHNLHRIRLNELLKMCVLFRLVLKMGSISGRRKAGNVWWEWIMSSFIHPSIHHTWGTVISGNIDSARNSYWTDTDSCIHIHIHTFHIHNWKQCDAKAMFAKMAWSNIETCHSAAAQFWNTLSVLKFDFLNYVTAPTPTFKKNK